MKFGIVKLSVRWMSRQPPARAEIPTATRSAGNVLRLMSNTLLERAGARRPTRPSREFDARQYTAHIGWESMIAVGGGIPRRWSTRAPLPRRHHARAETSFRTHVPNNVRLFPPPRRREWAAQPLVSSVHARPKILLSMPGIVGPITYSEARTADLEVCVRAVLRR